MGAATTPLVAPKSKQKVKDGKTNTATLVTHNSILQASLTPSNHAGGIPSQFTAFGKVSAQVGQKGTRGASRAPREVDAPSGSIWERDTHISSSAMNQREETNGHRRMMQASELSTRLEKEEVKHCGIIDVFNSVRKSLQEIRAVISSFTGF